MERSPVLDISKNAGRVKSFLISLLFFLHTPLHERGHAHFSELSCLCPTCWLGPSCFIDSVLPTKHLSDHCRP